MTSSSDTEQSQLMFVPSEGGADQARPSHGGVATHGWGLGRSPVGQAGRKRRGLWLVIVAVLALGGTFGSIVAASKLALNDHQDSHDDLVTSSKAIASTLQLDLQHEQDLATAAGADSLDNANLTQTEFVQWAKSIQAFSRYPELQGISDLKMVSPTQLAAFGRSQEADPPGPLRADGLFAVSPSGARPYYCLIAVSDPRHSADILPVGLDYCTTALGPALLRARSSGQSTFMPYKSGSTEELAIGTATYSGGTVPTTAAARRLAFDGWTGTEILPDVLLEKALDGHSSTAVEFHFAQGPSAANFTAGSAPRGAASTTVNLRDGWSVRVSGKVKGGGILADRNALVLLLAGLALTYLLGALILVLGTSRSRALQLVHQRTDELRYQAFHDPLTGLPNRALILDRISQMMARARREHTTMAAFFLDLDNFKDINDTLGHKCGDELLFAVGARLNGVIRQGDTIGRLGGDEFVMVVSGESLALGVDSISSRIASALKRPISIPGTEAPLNITTSIGIATGDRLLPEELLRDADVALYRAKAAGKNRAVLFSPSMQASVDDHRNLELDLRIALEKSQFFLVYQPMVHLESGTVRGFEALLRWRHPERGVIQPNAFIPALEASGMIVAVGRWVLEAACRQGAQWSRQGYPVKISVNVATAQLQVPDFADQISEVLFTSGFDPGQLVLELTETTMMRDPETIVARLDELKALGVRVALDDFGTGFSSLARLQQFPIDILKIDRSFISQCSDSDLPSTFVRAIVQLAKTLGLEVVAEGIETSAQWDYLTAEQVDVGQGFLFARPLEVDAVDHLLSQVHVPPEDPRTAVLVGGPV
jgi:diguanylate cyclase (GGDEF)-like protein